MTRLALLVLLLASCGKKPEPAASSKAPISVDPAPAETEPQPEPPEKPPAPPPPSGPRPAPAPPPVAPRLSLTLNGSDAPEVPTGTPILLELVLTAPPGESLALRASGGSWSSFVRLQAPGPEWVFRPALQVGPVATLDASNAAVLVWTLPAKTVDRLPRGEHAIGVTLDTRQGAASDSWSGLVQPPPIRIRLTSGPPSATRTELLVRCALWERSNEEALRLVEKELSDHPESPPLLALKAEVLEAAGRPRDALRTLDEAVASAARQESPSQVYASLRTALRRRLESKGK